MNKRTVAKVLGWVGAALVLLELIYVVAAKIALKKLPELASYEALQMTYSDAGSWFPGRAWVRDFVVSGHDYNIQFEVRVKEAQVKVDIFRSVFTTFPRDGSHHERRRVPYAPQRG